MPARINIYNPEAIDTWLAAFTPGHGDSANLETARLLPLALHNALAKEPSCLKPLDALPADAPGWLAAKWAAGERDFHEFRRDPALADKIRHIADWIGGAVVSDAPWLKDTDDRGRPKKLLKIGSLDQATGEADKAMRRLAAKFNSAGGGEDGIEIVKQFPDGYAIVRLLTAQALDRETGMMGHCVGGGNYDANVQNGKIEIYSLRDDKNCAHATMEVHTESNILQQCKGKQNKPPVAAYFPYLREFITKRCYQLNESPFHTGLLEQDGNYYSIFDLPDNFHWRGDLDLSQTEIKILPRNLHIDGTLDISDTQIRVLPEGLHVDGNIDLRSLPITNVPEGLYTGGNLNLSGTSVTALPENLHVGGNLYLNGAGIITLSEGLYVGGDLFLNSTYITSLPENIYVECSIILPDRKTMVRTIDEARKKLAESAQGKQPQSIPAPA